MAKKKPKRTGISLHVYIDPAIDEALSSYLSSTDPQVPKTAAVESALRLLLQRAGFWPPKADDAEGDSDA